MPLKILLGSAIFYVTGLYLLTQSIADWLLKREVFGFNWRMRQWHPLTGYHAHLLTFTRFGYGCLLLAAASIQLILVAFCAWAITELALGYQPLPKQKRAFNHDDKGNL